MELLKVAQVKVT